MYLINFNYFDDRDEDTITFTLDVVTSSQYFLSAAMDGSMHSRRY